jgi:hypothetical protein
MSKLSVPAPSLKYEPTSPNVAILEKPVTIAGPAVKLLDGTPVTDQIIGVVAGFLLYRQTPNDPGPQVWDAEAKAWKSGTDAVSLTLQPKPLTYKDGAWEGIFVAAADKGAVEAGGNLYSFRTLFRVPYQGSTLSALSLPTTAIRFVAATDAMQAGIKMVDAPETATEMTIYLRNAAKEVIGSVQLVNQSGTARIDVSNTAGARVRLAANGDVELRPANGRSVIVQGHLVTDTLHVEHP